jgi:sulfate permease, SulP family
MKFTKFFLDFTSGYIERDKQDRVQALSRSVIQFLRLKLILDMIKNNNNRVDLSKLNDSEREAASSVGDDATQLFCYLLTAQIDMSDGEYCSRMVALPKRLQVAFRMSMVRNLPDGETTYRDGALFSVTSRNAGFTAAESTIHQPDEVYADRLGAYLEPIGDLFTLLADETSKIANYAYINFTAAQRLLKKFMRLSGQAPQANLLNLQSKFDNAHFVKDQVYLKSLLTTLIPGLTIKASHQLLTAAADNDIETVRKLIYIEGADVSFSSPPERKTPLHIAASLGNGKLLELLITLKANVNALDTQGMTPLAAALVCDASPSLDCARLLRDAGGDMVLPTSSFAMREMYMQACDAASRGDLGRLRKLWAAGVPFTDGVSSVLHAACESGSLETARFLLTVNAVDPTWKNRYGKTALESVSIDAGDGLVTMLLGVASGAGAVPLEDRLTDLLGVVNPLKPSPSGSALLGRQYVELSESEDAKDNTEGATDSLEPLGCKYPIFGYIWRQARPLIMSVAVPEWLTQYDWRRDLKDDAISGVSLAGMYIPGAMAMSHLVGLEPVYGIYAGVLAPVVYAWFCSARHVVVGPLFMICLLIGNSLSSFPQGATPETVMLFALEIALVFTTMGVFGLGFLASFLSGPALEGFTTAAALLAMGTQLNLLLGTHLAGANTLLIQGMLMRNIRALPSANLGTCCVSICAFGLFLYLKKNLPGKLAMLTSMIVMFTSMIVSVVFGLGNLGIATVGRVQGGLPVPVGPEFTWDGAVQLFPSALFVAVVAFIESIAAAKKCSRMFGYQIGNDRELVVLGLSNFSLILTGGLPVFGSLIVTSANAGLGGKTPMVMIIRSAMLLFVLLLFTGVFSPLPKASLAVILVMAIVKTADFSVVGELWETSKSDLCVWISACVLTLFSGVQVGMATAALLSLIVFVARTSKPRVVVSAREIGSLQFVPIDNTDKSKKLLQLPFTKSEVAVNELQPDVNRKGVLVMSFQSPLWYANSEIFRDRALELLTWPKVHGVIMDMSAVSFIDGTALETLKELADMVAKRAGKFVVFACVTGGAASSLVRKGLHLQFAGLERQLPEGSNARDYFAVSVSEGVRRANISWAGYKRSNFGNAKRLRSGSAVASKSDLIGTRTA